MKGFSLSQSYKHVAVLVLIVSLLSACGWHLRGSKSVELDIKQLAVDNQTHDGLLYQRLLIKLKRAGVEVVGASTGVPMITLYRVTQTRKTLTVVDGKASEYELLYRLEFDVKRADEVLLEKQSAEASRIYSYDANQVLAKEREQDRLYQETRNDVIDAVLFRLRTIEVQGS